MRSHHQKKFRRKADNKKIIRGASRSIKLLFYWLLSKGGDTEKWWHTKNMRNRPLFLWLLEQIISFVFINTQIGEICSLYNIDNIGPRTKVPYAVNYPKAQGQLKLGISSQIDWKFIKRKKWYNMCEWQNENWIWFWKKGMQPWISFMNICLNF